MLIVSNYHYIRKSFEAPYKSIFGVTPKEFKSQLKEFEKSGSFIHPKELLLNADEILGSKEKFYLITFDDGLKEQMNLAMPILDELNIPAIFFVNSVNHEEQKISSVHKIHLIRSQIDSNIILEFLDKNHNVKLFKGEFDKAYGTYIYDKKLDAEVKYLLNFKISHALLNEVIDELFNEFMGVENLAETLYMSKKDLIELSKRGFLGSHTHNHIPIAKLNDDELIFELKHSKEYLEKVSNSNIDFISYPYGTKEACDQRVAQFAKDVGYKIGFSTIRGNNLNDYNLLLLNRFDCNDLPGSKKYKK